MTDLVSLIEAAYAGDGDDRAWLERILELSRPWLDDGMGAAAFLYDARRARAGAIERSGAACPPEGALEVWRGLVDGRWSLVDHFDHDGRRYLLARKNEPSLPTTEPLPLTRRERQVLAQVARGWPNKTIAYHLGLSPSAVSTHLSNAMKKLGARNRVEAAGAFRRRP